MGVATMATIEAAIIGAVDRLSLKELDRSKLNIPGKLREDLRRQLLVGQRSVGGRALVENVPVANGAQTGNVQLRIKQVFDGGESLLVPFGASGVRVTVLPFEISVAQNEWDLWQKDVSTGANGEVAGATYAAFAVRLKDVIVFYNGDTDELKLKLVPHSGEK